MSLTTVWTCTLCVVLAALAAPPGAAQGLVVPVSYDMLNGGVGTYAYHDEIYDGAGDPTMSYSWLSGGLGQLTDGTLGVTSWLADLGNGPAYEWVAWLNRSPTITFDFGRQIVFTSVAVHGNNSGAYGVKLFTRAKVSCSNDGVHFNGSVVQDTPASALAQPIAQFVTVPTVQQARFVRIELTPGSPWTFVSEVQFNGTAVGAVPEPASLAVLLSMTAALAAIRRRRC